jgi:signal transduction histidine kinase
MAFVSLASWALAGLAMRPIRRSFQQMQQFTADAAHELRTPIAAAQATVESVLGGTLPSGSDAEEMLQVLDRQHQRLSQLIQDLLLLTRLDCQVQTNPLVPCCLQDLVSDLVEELAALALHKHIHFQAQMEAKLPLYVLGDEAQLYRLVFNLVVNALQYTPDGGQVTISLGQQAQQALIAIQDTGMGIAPNELAKIFDRFYRVDHDRSRQTGGSGLGLSIAQAIAHIHCGEITVQSQPDLGSTFTIHLPIAPHQ